MKILTSHTLVILAVLLAVLPGHSVTQEQTEKAVVSSINTSNQPGAITSRQQLDDQVRRFADRYHSRMSIAVDRMREYPLTSDQFQLAQYWRTMSRETSVDIAIDSNAVTNLLDMMVLTSLGRMVIEQYWVPERFSKEYGQPLLDASRALEKDVWDLADAVLTSEQQSEMLIMISNRRFRWPMTTAGLLRESVLHRYARYCNVARGRLLIDQ